MCRVRLYSAAEETALIERPIYIHQQGMIRITSPALTPLPGMTVTSITQVMGIALRVSGGTKPSE